VVAWLVILPLALSASSFLDAGLARSLPPIRAGVLLIANPQMEDPNFRETVVLICRHGSDGTLGFVLNRKTDRRLADVLPDQTDLKETSAPLFAGGPVQPTGVLFLFRVQQPPADSQEVIAGVYWGGNLTEVRRIVTEGKPTETFHAFAGHAGWAPGQLQSELAVGAWAAVPADAALVFEQDPTDLWRLLLDRHRSPQYIDFPEFPHPAPGEDVSLAVSAGSARTPRAS
ncbi:MAG: YqgE/AlgH family protein, partial [Nitrospirales bacterium]